MSAMYNLRLIGGRLDQINLRVSVTVIVIFTIITIVSYFYELSRAGLLSRHAHYHPRFPHLHREAREITEAAPGLLSRHPLHQLGSQIDSIKDKLRLRNKGDEAQEINIAVHLGKNDSYVKVNNTSFQAYQHKNTHSNFYTKSCLNSSTLSSPDTCMRNITAKTKLYNNATQVLVYQHDPGGYFMRDCLKFVAQNGGKVVADVPLNSARREEWDHQGLAKKSGASVLYGGLAFGVCESVDRPCLYMTLLSHPITRILTLYDVCARNRSSAYCKVNGLQHSNVTLDQFIHAQRNNLFHKLLYNHRHCTLVGRDEICLPNSGTSFVFSQSEKKAYLDDIVSNLEKWFGLVGLVNHLPETLKIFENALGLKFTKCLGMSELVGKQYKDYVEIKQDNINDNMKQIFYIKDYLRVSESAEYIALKEDLENDPEVQRILQADLVIYKKIEEMFERQLKAIGLLEQFKKVTFVMERTSQDGRNDNTLEKTIAERHLSRKMSEYEVVGSSESSKMDVSSEKGADLTYISSIDHGDAQTNTKKVPKTNKFNPKTNNLLKVGSDVVKMSSINKQTDIREALERTEQLKFSSDVPLTDLSNKSNKFWDPSERTELLKVASDIPRTDSSYRPDKLWDSLEDKDLSETSSDIGAVDQLSQFGADFIHTVSKDTSDDQTQIQNEMQNEIKNDIPQNCNTVNGELSCDKSVPVIYNVPTKDNVKITEKTDNIEVANHDETSETDHLNTKENVEVSNILKMSNKDVKSMTNNMKDIMKTEDVKISQEASSNIRYIPGSKANMQVDDFTKTSENLTALPYR